MSSIALLICLFQVNTLCSPCLPSLVVSPPGLAKNPMLASPTLTSNPQGPGSKSMADAVKNSSGGPATMRSFAQILEQEKKDRNILELRITKIRTEEALLRLKTLKC